MPLLFQLALYLAFAGPAAPGFDANHVVSQMVQADNRRLSDMRGYTSLRRYRLDNNRFNKHAVLTVRLHCKADGAKTFEVVSATGSGFVRKHVLMKMVEAEVEASNRAERNQNRILPANYEFHAVGTETIDGRPQYVFDVIPKTRNKFLLEGRIWVDAADFAITRIEGKPAKNPSFWTSRIEVHHRYEKVGEFWLPERNASRAQVKIFGQTDVTIEYFDYQLPGAPEQSLQSASQQDSAPEAKPEEEEEVRP